jgi:hypothetical protein
MDVTRSMMRKAFPTGMMEDVSDEIICFAYAGIRVCECACLS